MQVASKMKQNNIKVITAIQSKAHLIFFRVV